MNGEAHKLLHGMPDNTPGDAGDLTGLDTEHIPWDRVPKLQALLSDNDDFAALQAAMLLAHWGNDAGLDYLCALVDDGPPLAGNRTPHSLQGYDDTSRDVLDALVAYWAKQSEAGHGEEARKKLLKPVSRIIHLSSTCAWGSGISPGWSKSMASPGTVPVSRLT